MVVEHVGCYHGHALVHVVDEGVGAGVDWLEEVVRDEVDIPSLSLEFRNDILSVDRPGYR